MEVNSKYYSSYNPDAPPDWKMHNKGITPMFFTEDVKLFELDGKTPRHGPDGKCTREQEYCRILIAGDGLCEASHIVDDLIKERFADEYALWKAGLEKADAGFSFDECTFIGVKQARELESNNIFNLRDLAAVTDGNLYCMARLRELREKAIAWLADKEGHAVTDKLAEQNAQMQAELEHLRRQMARMEAARRPKRKTKRKPVSAETRVKLREANLRRIEREKGQPSSPEAA